MVATQTKTRAQVERTKLQPVTGDEPHPLKAGTPIEALTVKPDPETETVKVVEGPNGRTRENFYLKMVEEKSEMADGKIALNQMFNQRLAEAFDTYAKADALNLEAAEIASDASKAIILNASKRIASKQDAVLGKKEISGFLCNIFGAKEKGGKGKVSPTDKDASATPHGNGEVIRKRIARLIDAHSFLSGAEVTSFFEPMEGQSDIIKDIVDRVYEADPAKNPLSIFSAYDMIGKAVKEAQDAAIPMHLNYKRIAKLSGDIAQHINDVVEAQVIDANLRAAYVALFEQVEAMGQAIEALEQEAA